jgi:hypothetical protein
MGRGFGPSPLHPATATSNGSNHLPVHRITVDPDNPSAGLAAKIEELEHDGESIVQVLSWANGWIIITATATQTAAARKPASQANLERRAQEAFDETGRKPRGRRA